MKKTKQEILKEQELFKIKYDAEKFEHYRERLEEMNIFELIEFLGNETEKIKFKEIVELDI